MNLTPTQLLFYTMMASDALDALLLLSYVVIHACVSTNYVHVQHAQVCILLPQHQEMLSRDVNVNYHVWKYLLSKFCALIPI